MKFHRPWQPHLDRDPLFNPFVPTTVRPVINDHVELAPAEDENGDDEIGEVVSEPTPDQPGIDTK